MVTWVKGSRFPGRHVRVILLMLFGIPGIQRRGDGKDCAPLPPKEWGVRWAYLAIFFLDLGLGEVCTGDAWNLPSEGTGVGFSGWSVQPKGLAHWRRSILTGCTVHAPPPTTTTTTITKRHFVQGGHLPRCVAGFSGPSGWPRCWWLHGGAAQGVPAAGESDASARTCVTSGWRSQWPLPSVSTTAQSAGRRQGSGERHEMHYTAAFRKRLSPKGGFCGMLWDSFCACT